MIFNISKGYAMTAPQMNESYPADVSTSIIAGTSYTAKFRALIVKHGRPAEYRYQWYDSNGAIPGATQLTYERVVSEDTNVQVWCQITNKAGVVSTRKAILKIDVYSLPVLDANYPADKSIKFDEGSSTRATFNVSIAKDGDPAEYSYQWHVNNKPVEGAVYESYTHTVYSECEDEIFCRVSNAAGYVDSRVATMTANYTVLYLYNKGDEYTKVTGGWCFDDAVAYGNVLRGDTWLECRATVYSCFGRYCYTRNKIDLTNYNRIYFYFDGIETGTYAFLSKTLGVPTASTIENRYPSDHWAGNWIAPKQFSIDISGLTGEHYPIVVAGPRVMNGGVKNDHAWFFLSKVWLE